MPRSVISPLDRSMTWIEASSGSTRSDWKTRRVPSGDQSGAESANVSSSVTVVMVPGRRLQ